jgi:hypothetical protein
VDNPQGMSIVRLWRRVRHEATEIGMDIVQQPGSILGGSVIDAIMIATIARDHALPLLCLVCSSLIR